MGPTERVILVKGDSTKWYNQAIFIVNQNMPAAKMPVDFVAEAERIIFNHISGQKKAAIAKAAAAPAAYSSHMPTPAKAAPLATAQHMKPVQKSTAPVAHTGAKKSRFDTVLNVVMVLAFIAIVAVFVYGFLS